MDDSAPRRRFLDEPFIVEQTSLARVKDLLRPLIHASALPGPMKSQLARMCLRLTQMSEELRRQAERLLAEEAERRRQAEEEP